MCMSRLRLIAHVLYYNPSFCFNINDKWRFSYWNINQNVCKIITKAVAIFSISKKCAPVISIHDTWKDRINYSVRTSQIFTWYLSGPVLIHYTCEFLQINLCPFYLSAAITLGLLKLKRFPQANKFILLVL